MKCRSTFVRRDLLLRHDRTVHAKDGGVPLVSEVKRRPGVKAANATTPARASKQSVELDPATLEQIEASSDGMVDLETAAMLMTDLHHKATAAMANQDEDMNDAAAACSPDHTTMFDTSVPYLAGAVPMPQMPWDTFMSQPVTQPKAHSVSSSVSGSQDSQVSQLSFNSSSTVQPHPNQLPPLMERFPSGGDALAPSLQSITNSMPSQFALISPSTLLIAFPTPNLSWSSATFLLKCPRSFNSSSMCPCISNACASCSLCLSIE